MVRTPCCKAELGLKKGAWTPKEDQKLVSYVTLHGEGGWRTLPERAGLNRCGKSCRLRWANYLRPNIKRGDFKEDEERSIISLHALHGNKWAAIGRELPGRTDNEIKNYWNTRIKKHLIKKGIDPVTHKGLIISDTEKSKNLLEKQKSYNDDDDIDNDKAKYSNKKSPSAKFLNRVANVFGKTNNTSVMSEIINRSGGPLITTSQTITTTTTNTSVTVDSESDKSTSSPFTPISNLLYSSTSSDSSLPDLMYCEDHHEDNVGFSSFLSDEDFMMLEESCVGNNYEFMRKRARFDATSFYENQDVFQEIDNFLHERNF